MNGKQEQWSTTTIQFPNGMLSTNRCLFSTDQDKSTFKNVQGEKKQIF